MFVCSANLPGNVCSATLAVLTLHPTSHKLSQTHRKKRGGKKKKQFLTWTEWVDVRGRPAQGGRGRKQREKSSISVGVQHQQPLWLRVKLLSLVQPKQVDAGSSPLQIRQALVSPSSPPFHRLAFLSEKSSTLSSLPLNPSVLLLLRCYSPDNHFTFSFSPLICCWTHNPYFPGARPGCYFLLC